MIGRSQRFLPNWGFNGWGYRLYHPNVKTPYLWSYTDKYSKGKYIEKVKNAVNWSTSVSSLPTW